MGAAGGWLQQEADSLAPEDVEFTIVSETQVLRHPAHWQAGRV